MADLLLVSEDEQKLLDAIVATYQRDINGFTRLTANLRLLLGELGPLIHSIRGRAKEPSSLYDKLGRKLLKSKQDGQNFAITPVNLFESIHDLAGIRLLHLHTSQFPKINQVMLKLLEDEDYRDGFD